MASFENEDGEHLGVDILGVDILAGSSVFSRPRYAAVLLQEGEIIDRYPDLSKRRLLRLIRELSPSYVASDNIFELVDDRRKLRALCAAFPPKTKLVQVTGSPYHGFKPLREISKLYNIPFSGKPNPMQTAEIVARLVDLGIGFIVAPFTDETKIIVSKSRHLGPGGWSEKRYARKIRGAIQKMAREITEKLEEKSLDFDYYEKRSEFGLDKAVFHVYVPKKEIDSFIKRMRTSLIQVKVEPVPSKTTTYRPINEEILTDLDLFPWPVGGEEERRLLPLIVGIDAGTTTAIAIMDFSGNLLHLSSSRECSRSEIIKLIIRYGKPAIIASDVPHTPSLLAKLAATFQVKVHNPKEDIAVSAKTELVNSFLEENIFINDKPSNAHERDALTAAILVFKNYKNLFQKIDSKIELQKLGINPEAVKVLVIQGMKISDAIMRIANEKAKEKELLETIRSKEVPQEREIQNGEKIDEDTDQRLVNRLKRRLDTSRKQCGFLEQQNEELKHKLEANQNRISELEKQLEYLRSEKAKDLTIKRLHIQHQFEVKRLEEDKKNLFKETELLKDEINRLKETILLASDPELVPIKVIPDFSLETTEKAITELKIAEKDIVLIKSLSGASSSTAKILAETGIKTIIVPKSSSIPQNALSILKEKNTILLEEEKLEILFKEPFAFMRKNLFEEAVKQAEQKLEEEQEGLLKERLGKMVSEYRFLRRKELTE